MVNVTMLKNSEINGTEEIGLVTPTAGLFVWTHKNQHILSEFKAHKNPHILIQSKAKIITAHPIALCGM